MSSCPENSRNPRLSFSSFFSQVLFLLISICAEMLTFKTGGEEIRVLVNPIMDSALTDQFPPNRGNLSVFLWATGCFPVLSGGDVPPRFLFQSLSPTSSSPFMVGLAS